MGRPLGHQDAFSRDEDPDAQRLLQLIQALTAEFHPHRRTPPQVTLDSDLARDLGLDSLARVELIARIEKHFHVALPEQAYAEVETPRDLLRVLAGASQAVTLSSPPHEDSRKDDGTAMPPASTASQAAHTPVPDNAATLMEVLAFHSERCPERTHIRFYSDGDGGEQLGYGELLQAARGVAGGLQALGVRPGEAVVLMLGSDRDYFFAFFGVLLGGAVPVPIYPPARPGQIEDHMRRHSRIVANCRARVMITVPAGRGIARLMKAQVESLRHIVTVAELQAPDDYVPVRRRGSDTAFIQYTSGSTGNPKGVVLSHDNLLANIRAMGECVGAHGDDVFVSWLPLYHDMGLIGAWLGSLYYGAGFVVMSPLSFLSRPQRWLWAIHRYGGTLSAAPNFGYELCLRRIDDADLEGLELGGWRAAFNGAESVSPQTLERFCERFAAWGFRREAMTPVYGLAESTVGLAFPPLGRGPLIDRIQREPFMRDGHAVPAAAEDETALRFVSCGRPLPHHQIRIADRTGRELPERREGHLQFRGPSATRGYYRNPEATRRLFQDGWLDSGDMAYIAEGEVYLTGRAKDIIIRAGRNLYPHELEEAVGELPGIRAGRVAAFGSKDAATGTERLVIVAETRERDASVQAALRRRINAVVTDLVGAPPDDVLLAPPDTLLKTSSGKIRRDACRQLYEAGRLVQGRRAVWWQVARLLASGFLPQLRRAWRLARDVGYGIYARSLFWLIAPWTWLLVLILPRPAWRWQAMRRSARLLARLTATPLSVEGLEHLPPAGEPCIYVANHASYLDGPAVIAALPREVSFIAKAELSRQFFAGRFLRRIGTEFVERFDVRRGVEDARAMNRAAAEGRSLFFFPEGTFTRKPGLLPFYMGAFSAAVSGGVPVVPVALRGTRSILRADTWLPAHGRIRVIVGEPLSVDRELAQRDPWAAAVSLRDAARAWLLRHCGEPDLVMEKPFRDEAG